jgi:YD repeat-containing protein
MKSKVVTHPTSRPLARPRATHAFALGMLACLLGSAGLACSGSNGPAGTDQLGTIDLSLARGTASTAAYGSPKFSNVGENGNFLSSGASTGQQIPQPTIGNMLSSLVDKVLVATKRSSDCSVGVSMLAVFGDNPKQYLTGCPQTCFTHDNILPLNAGTYVPIGFVPRIDFGSYAASSYNYGYSYRMVQPLCATEHTSGWPVSQAVSSCSQALSSPEPAIGGIVHGGFGSPGVCSQCNTISGGDVTNPDTWGTNKNPTEISVYDRCPTGEGLWGKWKDVKREPATNPDCAGGGTQAGNPVDVTTGAKVETLSCFGVAGCGIGISAKLRYSTERVANGIGNNNLAAGWTVTYARALLTNDAGAGISPPLTYTVAGVPQPQRLQVLYANDDGVQTSFYRDAATDDYYLATETSADYSQKVSWNQASQTWTFYDTSGTQERYDISGHLVQIQRLDGGKLTFEWTTDTEPRDPADQGLVSGVPVATTVLIQTVASALDDRTLQFVYVKRTLSTSGFGGTTATSDQLKLVEIRDALARPAPERRNVRIFYNPMGELIRVQDDLGRHDFTYESNGSGYMTSRKDGNMQTGQSLEGFSRTFAYESVSGFNTPSARAEISDQTGAGHVTIDPNGQLRSGWSGNPAWNGSTSAPRSRRDPILPCGHGQDVLLAGPGGDDGTTSDWVPITAVTHLLPLPTEDLMGCGLSYARTNGGSGPREWKQADTSDPSPAAGFGALPIVRGPLRRVVREDLVNAAASVQRVEFGWSGAPAESLRIKRYNGSTVYRVDRFLADTRRRLVKEYVPSPSEASLSTKATVYTYNGSDYRVAAVTDPEGRMTTISRARTGRIETVTTRTNPGALAEGGEVKTVVRLNQWGKPTHYEDPLGRWTDISYNSTTQVVQSISLKGLNGTAPALTTTFAYTNANAVGQPSSVTAADGTVTATAFDSRCNPATITVASGQPEAQSTTFSYDWRGFLLATTDPRGVTTTYTVDKRARRTSQLVDAGGRALRTDYVYDPQNNITRTIENAGGTAPRRTDYTYFLTTEAEYLPQSAVVGVGTQVAWTQQLAQTSSSYLPAGELALSVTPGTTGASTRTTAIAYEYNFGGAGNTRIATTKSGRAPFYAILSGAGDLLSTTDARGATNVYTYQAGTGRMATITIGTVSVEGSPPANVSYGYSYNSDGTLVGATGPSGYSKTLSYDAYGQLSGATETGTGVTAPQVTSQVYVPAGQPGYGRGLVRDSVLGGVLSRKIYDRVGRVAQSIVDPSGQNLTTTYQYVENAESDRANLRRVVDPKGNITRYRYNSLGLLDQTTDAAGGTFTYTYDNLGRVVQQTGPGNAQYWSYDALGRRTAAAMNGTNATSGTFPEVWHYNADSSIKAYCPPSASGGCGLSATNATSANGAWVYSYDAAGRMAGIDYPETSGVASADASYAYLANDLLASVTDANGKTAYTYDALNRVAVSARCTVLGCTPDVASDATANNKRLVYSYKANDTALASLQYWNRGSVSYTTNALGQVTQLTDWAGNPTTYAYSGTGQLATANVNAGTAFTSTYAYDTARRLSRITHAKGGGNLLDLRYDGFAAGENDFTGAQLAGRDANGNIRGIKETWGAEGALTHSFGYDALNRVTGIKQAALQAGVWGTTGAAAINVTNAYDARGNAVSFMGKLFTYDANDRLLTQPYTFDANGNMLASGSGAVSQSWNMIDPVAVVSVPKWNSGPTSWGLNSPEDIDGDGNVDLYTQRTWGFMWRKGAGDGTFGSILSHADDTGTSTDYFVWGVADINGDGKLDSITTNAYSQNTVGTRLRVGLYVAPGVFNVVETATSIPMSCTVAYVYDGLDFNNDNRDDILARCGTDFVVRLGQADGTLSAPVVTAATGASPLVANAIFDVNGDGKLDIVARGPGTANPYGVQVFYGTGTGGFTPASVSGTSGLWNNLNRFTARGWADFDGDGVKEVFVDTSAKWGGPSQASPNVSMYFVRFASNGSTVEVTASTTSNIANGWTHSEKCEPTDENGDGKLDILCKQISGSLARIIYYRNTSVPGTISFAPGTVITSSTMANTPTTSGNGPWAQYVTGGPIEPAFAAESPTAKTVYFWKR